MRFLRILIVCTITWIIACFCITRLTSDNRLPIHAGQTVAVVGNGPSVLTQTLGQKIDSCDVIIRFNAAKIIPLHTGEKTTIHVITGGSTKNFIDDTHRIIVHNHILHNLRPIPCFHCMLLGNADAIGVTHPQPTSGLIIIAYLSAMYPNSTFLIVGFDGMQNEASFSKTHYYPANDSTRTIWDKIFTGVGMGHHSDESYVFQQLVAARSNLHFMS